MKTESPYPIGTPGKPWGDAEKAQWLASQVVQRSYNNEVLVKLKPLESRFKIEQYGALSFAPEHYPLFAVQTKNWDSAKRSVLITGGVHGYETSGVQGALRFLEGAIEGYVNDYNFVVAPCVSPWGYETINRWNTQALDPNRSFRVNSPAEEAAALIKFLDSLDADFIAHFDLHETTDTDNSEFRPALVARDAKPQTKWHIPDGFYTVGDSEKHQPEFQKAIIDSVAAVTHIAPADESGGIIGEDVQQPGVIHYAAAPLGLCMGITDATYVTTTEVYPDSPKVDDENCTLAQVAAVVGGLDYIRR